MKWLLVSKHLLTSSLWKTQISASHLYIFMNCELKTPTSRFILCLNFHDLWIELCAWASRLEVKLQSFHDIRELSHQWRTDSGTVIWYENRSAHAWHPPHLFVVAKIANTFLPIYRPRRIKTERVKQPISALLGDSWVHSARSHATPYVLQCAKSQIRRTTDEWRGRSQFVLEYIGARYAKARYYHKYTVLFIIKGRISKYFIFCANENDAARHNKH